MRLAVLRSTSAILLLAGCVAVAASPARAAVRPHVEVTPPAVVGAGLNASDMPVRVVNAGGVAQRGVGLRLTITPLAGSPVRPLEETLVLTYQFGVQDRPLKYETHGDTLVATTPTLASVDPGGSTTLQLKISTRPTIASHVDRMTVKLTTEALDDFDDEFATDRRPDRIALVEPRAALSLDPPMRFRLAGPRR